MKEEKILTKHPLGKSGRNIDKNIYDLFKTTMLSVLAEHELSHDELMSQMQTKLKNKFKGNIFWYSETVKLDLEARKLIERTNSRPQKYKLK